MIILLTVIYLQVQYMCNNNEKTRMKFLTSIKLSILYTVLFAGQLAIEVFVDENKVQELLQT